MLKKKNVEKPCIKRMLISCCSDRGNNFMEFDKKIL